MRATNAPDERSIVQHSELDFCGHTTELDVGALGHPGAMTQWRPLPKGSITHRLSPEDVEISVGVVVKVAFDERQRRRMQHLHEQLLRLIVRRDLLDEIRDGINVNAFGQRIPTLEQREALFEATQNFLEGFYATMNAFQSFLSHFTYWQEVEQRPVPRRGVEKFISWLSKLDGVDPLVFEELSRARAARTLLTHPDERVFDWGTTDYDGGLQAIVLFGDANGNGHVPDFAQKLPGFPGDWQMVMPSEVSVTNCIGLLLHHVASGSHVRKFRTQREIDAWMLREAERAARPSAAHAVS